MLLIVILLGLLLAILWLSVEVRRLKERRKYYIPMGTNSQPALNTNTPAVNTNSAPTP
jgi:hypothetical protein